jgi:hypothetical protein
MEECVSDGKQRGGVFCLERTSGRLRGEYSNEDPAFMPKCVLVGTIHQVVLSAGGRDVAKYDFAPRGWLNMANFSV